MDLHLQRPVKRVRSDLNLSLDPTTPPTTNSTSVAVLSHRHLRTLNPEERGIHLVELLLACAAQTTASNVSHLDACLRLVCSLSSPSGDSMQRLAARLSAALVSRLLRRRWHGILSSLRRPDSSFLRTTDRIGAQRAFARALPYRSFAHVVVGRTVLRALSGEHVVHLVELGSTHSSAELWVPVLRALARTPRGVKLTCVGADRTALESLRSALTKEAATLDVPFQFNSVESALRELDPSALRVRAGEAVAVVAILSLHELLADEEGGEGRMERFLNGVRTISPRVVVTVEQEADHNGGRMTERFAEAVEYYGAVFESVEAAAKEGRMTGEERAGVEEMVGREAENVVAFEGEERVERHERRERWAARMARAGFRQERVPREAGEEGRRLVESWPGSGRYGVVVYGGCPTICWHDRPLYAAAAWV